MKALYREFFYIPKHEKVREKVMLCRTAITVVVMILCLAAMSITAYAYFSYNLTSGSNIIKAANFDAQISITPITDKNSQVNPSSTDGKKTEFTFGTTGTYIVKLEKGSSSADTGFCIVYVGEDKYHTQQIGLDITANNEKRESVEFILKINTPNTVVAIESHWGTSTYYDGFNSTAENPLYIVNKSEIVIGTPVIETNKLNMSDETLLSATTTTATTLSAETSTTSVTESAGTTTVTTTATTLPAETSSTSATEPTGTTATEEIRPTTQTTGIVTTEATEQ